MVKVSLHWQARRWYARHLKESGVSIEEICQRLGVKEQQIQYMLRTTFTDAEWAVRQAEYEERQQQYRERMYRYEG